MEEFWSYPGVVETILDLFIKHLYMIIILE